MRSQFPHRQSGGPIPHLVIRLLFNGEDKDSFKYFLPTIIHFIKVWQDEKCICFLEMAFLQGSHLPERGCKSAQWEKTEWLDTLGYGSQGEIRVRHRITGWGNAAATAVHPLFCNRGRSGVRARVFWLLIPMSSHYSSLQDRSKKGPPFSSLWSFGNEYQRLKIMNT